MKKGVSIFVILTVVIVIAFLASFSLKPFAKEATIADEATCEIDLTEECQFE